VTLSIIEILPVNFRFKFNRVCVTLFFHINQLSLFLDLNKLESG